MARQHALRSSSSSLPSRLRNRYCGWLAAFCAIPCSEVGIEAPALHVRAMLPVQAAYPCQPLPHVSGATVSEEDGLIGRPSGPWLPCCVSGSPTWFAVPGQFSRRVGSGLPRFQGFPAGGSRSVSLASAALARADVSGTARASHVLDASLHASRALRGPRQTLRALTPRGLFG
jgi:hypothetical protein